MRRLFRYSLLVLPLLLSACVPAVRMKGDASLLAAQHAREQALAPAADVEPLAQVSQLVAPLSTAKVPASQAVHDAA